MTTSERTNALNQSHSKIKWYCKLSTWFRIGIILTLLTLIILASVYNHKSEVLLLKFLQWMEENIWIGSIAFMTIFILTTISMIPASILTLGAGFVYCDILGTWQGVLIATTIVWISASIGATISFINGRYLLRTIVVKYISKRYPIFNIIESIVKEYGFSVTFWLRLSSLTPYNVFNYFMGITSVRLMDYVLAHIGMVCICYYLIVYLFVYNYLKIFYSLNHFVCCVLIKIPDITVYAFVGGSISTIIEVADTGIGDNFVFMIVLGSTLTLSIIGMIVISCYAKKKFKKLKQEMMEKEHVSDNEYENENDLEMDDMKCTSVDTEDEVNEMFHD